MTGSEDLNRKLSELGQKAEEAEQVQQIVESREPMVQRLTEEIRRIRMENHFTDLFMGTIGVRR